MRTNISITAFIIAASLAVGCISREDVTGISRLEAFRDRYQDNRREGEGTVTTARLDTSVFVTAVEFPDGYDWRRDSSYGAVAGRLVLYRDGERLLAVPAGLGSRASLAPDLHHLVDGHLYTEFCTADETVVARDGEDIFSYGGREILRGLLVEGEDVYTLGQNRSGSGFALRRNGEPLFVSDAGSLASHMSSDPAYPTGALYRDGGNLCFSYWKPLAEGSATRVWYVVEDGVETAVDAGSGEVSEIRVVDGAVNIIPRAKAYSWERWQYRDGKWSASVTVNEDDYVIASAPFDTSRMYYLAGCMFLSFRNACLAGPHFYIGINPRSAPDGPWLWRDGEKVLDLELNGYITAVGVRISPAR